MRGKGNISGVSPRMEGGRTVRGKGIVGSWTFPLPWHSLQNPAKSDVGKDGCGHKKNGCGQMEGFGVSPPPSSLISCGDAVWVSTKPDTGKSRQRYHDI